MLSDLFFNGIYYLGFDYVALIEKNFWKFKKNSMDSHRLKTAKIIADISLAYRSNTFAERMNITSHITLLGRDACSREDDILEPLQ